MSCPSIFHGYHAWWNCELNSDGVGLMHGLVTVCSLISVLASLMIVVSLAVAFHNSPSTSSAMVAGPKQAELRLQVMSRGYNEVLLWLSVGSLLTSLSWVLSPFAVGGDRLPSPVPCTVQALGLVYAPAASAMWTGCLSWEMYRLVVIPLRDLEGRFVRRRFFWYHVVGWGVPLLSLLILSCVRHVEPVAVVNMGFCWYGVPLANISVPANGGAVPEGLPTHLSLVPLLALYIPRTVVLVFIMVCYGFLLWKVWSGALLGDSVRRGVLAFCLYPISLLVVAVPAMLENMELADGDRDGPHPGIDIATVTLAPSQGTLNAIVFLATTPFLFQQVGSLLGRNRCCGVRVGSPASGNEQPLLPRDSQPSINAEAQAEGRGLDAAPAVAAAAATSPPTTAQMVSTPPRRPAGPGASAGGYLPPSGDDTATPFRPPTGDGHLVSAHVPSQYALDLLEDDGWGVEDGFLDDEPTHTPPRSASHRQAQQPWGTLRTQRLPSVEEHVGSLRVSASPLRQPGPSRRAAGQPGMVFVAVPTSSRSINTDDG